MLPVAVLSLQILGKDHQGPILPQEPDDGPGDDLRSEPGGALLDPVVVYVPKAQEQRVVPHAHGPGAHEGLMDPHPAGIGHVGHGARVTPLLAVNRGDGAHEDHIVVGMGGNDEIIEMIRRFEPVHGEGFRQDALGIESDPRHRHALSIRQEGDSARAFLHLQDRVVHLRHVCL